MTSSQPAHSPPRGRSWLDQIFEARAARIGGVIMRQIADVEREVGRACLEQEVRRRGYHLLRTDTHYLIICKSGSIEIFL